MKVIWLDRDGFTDKTETMTPQQATAKVRPLLRSGRDGDGVHSLHPKRYCAALNLAADTLTVYSCGGSWCRENKEQCRGNGCS